MSRAIIVAIDQVNRLIEVDGTCRSKKYHFDEIRCITRTWAKNTRSDRRSKPRCGDFFFYEIEFENHDELIITGLMTDAPRLGFGPKQIEIDTYRIAWLKLKGRHIVNLEVNREPTSMKQGEHFSARGQAGH